MKASDAAVKLRSIEPCSDWFMIKSRVDETKSLMTVLDNWLYLFETYPNLRLKAILKYNVNRDFNCL